MRAVLLCALAAGLVRGAPLGQRSLDATLALIERDVAALEKMDAASHYSIEYEEQRQVNPHELKRLKKKKKAGFEAAEAKRAGFTLAEAKAAGYTKAEAKKGYRKEIEEDEKGAAASGENPVYGWTSVYEMDSVTAEVDEDDMRRLDKFKYKVLDPSDFDEDFEAF
jgi:uncharacterized protein YcbK (DUF882 family)